MKDRLGLLVVILLSVSLIALFVMVLLRIFRGGTPVTTKPVPTTSSVEVAEATPSPPPSDTPIPTETNIPEPTSTIFVPTFTPDSKDPANTPQEGCNVAAFVSDVTVPDNTVVDRKVSFTKTWRLLNDGTCTWTSDYKLYFYDGDQLSGPESQQLTTIDVPPGTSIDVSVLLTAPKDPGKYKGYWALKDGGGFHFGIGQYKNPFYVKIVVK
jgi:hypothetical protein